MNTFAPRAAELRQRPRSFVNMKLDPMHRKAAQRPLAGALLGLVPHQADAGALEYSATAQARRELYVAIRRARHQVALACVGTPSPLLDSSTFVGHDERS